MFGRFIALSAVAALTIASAAPAPARPPQPTGWTAVYRLVANGSNDHVYTIDPREVNILTQQGTHTYEGVAFQLYSAQQPGTLPVYRFVSAGGQHLLDTRNPSGADPFARFEATLGYLSAQQQPGLVPLQVWIHPAQGLYFFTTHAAGEFAAQNGYAYRGVLGFVAPGS